MTPARERRSFKFKTVVLGLAFVFLSSSSIVLAYRPFVSTDAAVADPKSIELEFGAFNLARERSANTFTVPGIVLNYGVVENLELVGELGVEQPPHGSVELVDPALSLKAVLKDGVLQEKPGISFAVEGGLLLPGTSTEQHRVGLQTTGILSGKLRAFTYHINLGGGIDRTRNHPFIAWGVIGELPIIPNVRVVAEINGESITTHLPDNSALVGIIWETPLSNIAVDGGVRRGISRAGPDWSFTAGLTFSFSLAQSAHN
jgi:hypothetical protein